jgi:hypothetical protein
MNEQDTPPPFPETRPEPASSETASARGWEGYSPEILDAVLDP